MTFVIEAGEHGTMKVMEVKDVYGGYKTYKDANDQLKKILDARALRDVRQTTPLSDIKKSVCQKPPDQKETYAKS